MTMFNNNLTQQAPYIPYYQRMNSEAAVQPMPYHPGMVQPQPAPAFMKGRPVASIDEAKAAQIDLDGSLNIFPDLNNKRIYTKQVNLDGTVTFNVFELNPDPLLPKTDSAYVTRTELDEALAMLKESLARPSAEPVSRTSIKL